MPISPGFSTKTLRRLRRSAEKARAKKLAVMARHKPGTAYHTRAMREANGYLEDIRQIDRILAGR